MRSDLSDLIRKTQDSLVPFLRIELELAGSYCEMARRTKNPEHKAKLLKHAFKAVEAIHHFQARVEDQTIREDLLKQAAKLERFLSQHSK